MPANRSVNAPRISPQFSGDEREINLLTVRRRIDGKDRNERRRFSRRQATTCSFVETMNDPA